MIVCGDFIDAQFGVMFGLTTMASAGLGNWLSDTVGLGHSEGQEIEQKIDIHTEHIYIIYIYIIYTYIYNIHMYMEDI